MAYGQNTKSERLLQFVPETTAGTYNAAATPILCRNLDHNWADNDTYDNERGSGRNHDAWSAVTDEEIAVDGEMVLYYSNFDDQLAQFMFTAPSGADDATATGVRTRNYKYPLSGRINRKTFSIEEGPAGTNAARRSTYGLIPSLRLTSERGNGGKTRANLTIVGRDYAEGITLTTGGVAPAILPVLPKHFKVYRAAALADLTEPEAYIGTLNKFELSLEGLVKPWYAKDRGRSYASHVDGGKDDLKFTASLTLPTDTADGHCSTMLAGAKDYVSTPFWYWIHAACPTTPYEIGFYLYASVNTSVGYDYNGNVEERMFPLSVIDNPADGYSFAIKTKVPSA